MLLLYGQLIGIGIFVAMGVVEEKSSRVVEVLLSTIQPDAPAGRQGHRPRPARPRAAARDRRARPRRPPAAAGAIDVDGDLLIAAGLALAWFIVGYAFYGAAFACAASLVPRQEDLQSVLTPLQLLLLVGFFLSFARQQRPRRDARRRLLVPPAASRR